MSEESTGAVVTKVMTLAEATEVFKSKTLEELQMQFAQEFGDLPYIQGTQDLSNDVALITKKLAYSLVLQDAAAKSLAVSPRTASYAQKTFDLPFEAKVKGVARTGGNTIQKFLVDRMWDLVQSGQTITAKQLADEVIAAFPESTYRNNPMGRVKADINKFNKGVFVYAQANQKIPSDTSQYFVPQPEAPQQAANEG